jgi:integrase
MAQHRGHNEGSIYQRKLDDGRVYGYQAQLSLPSGKRKTFSGKTKKEVQRKLDEAKASMLRGRVVLNSAQTIEQYLSSWLDTVQFSLKPRTHETYEVCVKRLMPSLGQTRLDNLQPANVQDAYNVLLKRGLSLRTVQMSHMVLHKALADAVRLDLVARNACNGATAPRPSRGEVTALSAEQLGVLIAGTRNDRFGALWILLGMSGPRIGEALALKWEDVDFESKRLQIRRSLQRQKVNGLVLTDTKNKRSRRTIELGQLTCDALHEHYERQVVERSIADGNWQDNGLLFCTAWGTPLDRGRVHLNWKAALKKVGLEDVRLHDLRHTAASLMLREGVHPKIVQEMLGHSSISITLDTYSHAMPTMHREAADRLDALLFRTSM